MGYVQLHGGSVSPEAALQAVRDMREGSAGGANLEVGASGVLCHKYHLGLSCAVVRGCLCH